MKSVFTVFLVFVLLSLPLVGVWIEIPKSAPFKIGDSLPLVGVWIEILLQLAQLVVFVVTPLGGSVD